jgi:alkylation response protein AidB-like acyl-CoA dehydrogenase
VLVDPADPLVDHADLIGDMFAVDIDGSVSAARPVGGALRSRLAPFAVPIELRHVEPTAAVHDAAPVAWLLNSATLLGYAERALELCIEHVVARYQFGQRLADFEAVQFQIADAVTAVSGLLEMCLFTTWRVSELREGAHTDALALRLHAMDVARQVLRTAQHLYGAAGFAEEYDISVLCRHAQSNLRLQVSSGRLLDLLSDAIRNDGFESLFRHGKVRP